MTIYQDVDKAKTQRVVYFAEYQNGNVKIGTTRRISERKKELEFLIGKTNIKYVFASSKFESELHRRYKSRLLHNETFSVSLSEIVNDVENEYDEVDYIQVDNNTERQSSEYYNIHDFSIDCENINKLKMFKKDFGGCTFTEAMAEYAEYNTLDEDINWIEDKTDLFFSIYAPQMPYWLAELLLDYDIEKIEHEYLLSYLINKEIKEKGCVFKTRCINAGIKDLESKIAAFIEVSDTNGKDDKEIYKMVKAWMDKGDAKRLTLRGFGCTLEKSRRQP